MSPVSYQPGPQLRLRRFEHAGVVVVQIAQHDVWAAQVQHAAAVDAGDRHQPGLHAGKQLPDAADTGGHRGVDGDHRRRLRDAVPLVDAGAEFLEPQLAHCLRQFLGAGDHVAQPVKVVRVRELRVLAEERAGAEQDAAGAVVDDLGNQAIVQGRGVQEQLDAGQDREAVRRLSGRRSGRSAAR